ncbi:MAG: SDR family NAD(P)-dependent oxidoreductase [Deltaproteobacteria bacterium]|nr:SDR family NAD(P)-dependent oxidoreductase [Deltaproteobacteria bacterium]
MDVTTLHGKTALVTGGASGIGKATALAFARRGADLILCDVNEAGLAATEQEIRAIGREVFTRRVDVADRDEMCAFAEAVHARIDAVDIVMNNAGVGLGAGLLDTSLDDWDWIVGINLRGVIHGCHYFVPAMVKHGHGGHVINLSSTAGYVASEALLAYSTTKFAVLGLSEALRQELRRHGIGVTAVCPGVINTPIAANARMRGVQAMPKVRDGVIDAFRRRNYPPARVAENILKAVQRNRAVAPISPEAWFAYLAKRVAPAGIAWLNRKLSDRVRREAGVA